MRAILAERGITDRVVWCADSFWGLPLPTYPVDAGDRHHQFNALQVSLDEVKENFRKYGLLDDQVRFLPGWFKDTLLNAPTNSLVVLRLDGDMHELTMQAFDALFPKVSQGGFVIVEDYALPGCRKAVEEFRSTNHITTNIIPIDWGGVY